MSLAVPSLTVNKGQTGARCTIFVLAVTTPEPDAAPDPPSHFFRMALGFEMGLAGLALVLGWLVGHAAWKSVRLDDHWTHQFAAVMWGAVGASPMLMGMWLLDRFPVGPLRNLREFVDRHLVPLFAPLSILQMVAVAVAAGVGEELLFRGLIQAALANWIGPPWGIVAGLTIASLLFGLCHCVTTTYAVLAALVGAYLGVLFLLTDSLLVPITTHAVYDAVALVYLVRGRRRVASGR